MLINEVVMKIFLRWLIRSDSSMSSLRRFFSWQLLCLALVSSHSALSEEQMVWITSDSDRFYASEIFSVIVSYETLDKGLATGLGIRIHFDSSQLSIESIASMFRHGKVGTQIKQDSDDFDNDPLTDKYLNAAWADVEGMWPESDVQPLTLLTLNVGTAEDFKGSQLNITISSADARYAASADNLVIGLAE